MAAKKKKSLFETQCVVNGTHWEWETANFRWRWEGLPAGMCSMVFEDDSSKPVAYFKNLDHAVAFTHGWQAGFMTPESLLADEGIDPTDD